MLEGSMPADVSDFASKLGRSLGPIGDMILGAPLNAETVEVHGPSDVPPDAYVGIMDTKEGDVRGFVVIERPHACAVAGLLIERPRAAIQENMASGELVGDDLDAVAEFANQLISPINDALRELGVENLHFVLKGGGADGNVEIPESGTFTLRLPVDPGDLGAGAITFIFPAASLQLEGIPEATDSPSDAPGAPDDASEAESSDSDSGDNPRAEAQAGGADPGRSPEDEAREDGAGADSGADADADAHEEGAGADPGGDADAAAASMQLTSEELAAIRDATKEMGATSRALFVVAVSREHDPWKARLEGAGLEFDIEADAVTIPRLLRGGEFGTVVIDADTCPSGGLVALAKVREARVPSLVVAVLVSSPTKSHLIGCLSAGADLYLRKPIDAAALVEALANVA